MKSAILKLVTLAAATLAAGTAFADHNSPMGEGWANMPNDIHNTRIDTRGDNETFRDFVRQGAGADSLNRYADDDSARAEPAGKKSAVNAGKHDDKKTSRSERQQREHDRATMRRLEGRALATGPGTRNRSMGGAGRRGRH